MSVARPAEQSRATGSSSAPTCTLQAQGVVTPDFQSYTGHGWYQTDARPRRRPGCRGKVHLRFPGLFNECWLYVNGEQVGHREFKGVWWMNDYRFEWDVDLAGKLQAGREQHRASDQQPAPFRRHVPPAVPLPGGRKVTDATRGTPTKRGPPSRPEGAASGIAEGVSMAATGPHSKDSGPIWSRVYGWRART